MAADPTPSGPTPAGVAADPSPADPLVAFLSGKRDGERHPCHVPAVLEGACGPAAVTALDLSDTGALVQLDEPSFVAAETKGGMRAFLELMQVHAAGNLRLAFPAHGLSLSAVVVRWTAGCAATGPSRLGLKFTRTLGVEELRALRSGVPLPAPAPATAAAAEALTPRPPAPTHVPRPGVRLQALVFLALKPELGPLAAGTAVAFGDDLAMLRIEGREDPAAMTRRLASGALFLVVLRGGLPVWEGTARPGPVLASAGGDALDIALLGVGPWPPALVKHLLRG